MAGLGAAGRSPETGVSPAVFHADDDGTGTIPITFFEAREDPWGFARSEPGPGIAGLDRVLAVEGPRQEINGKILGLGVRGPLGKLGRVSCAGCEKGRKRRRRERSFYFLQVVGWLSLIKKKKKLNRQLKLGWRV